MLLVSVWVKIMRWPLRLESYLERKSCLRSCREKTHSLIRLSLLLFLFDLLAGILPSLPPRDFHSSKKGKQKSGRQRQGAQSNLSISPISPSLSWLACPNTRRDQLKEFQRRFLCNRLLDSSLNTSYESYICPLSDGVWWTNLLQEVAE